MPTERPRDALLAALLIAAASVAGCGPAATGSGSPAVPASTPPASAVPAPVLTEAATPDVPVKQPPGAVADQPEPDLARLNAYAAAHADTFAGVYMEQPGGAVVVRFVGDLTAHVADVPRLVRGTRVIVRGARFTEAELRSLQDRIGADQDTIRQMGGALQSVAVDVIGNVVQVEASSADPGFPARLATHYGADRVKVIADGTGTGLLPYGSVRGRVVDAAGRPVAGMDVEVEPLEPIGPMAGTGHLTLADGSFTIPDLQPVLWRVEAGVPGADGMDWLAHVDIRVPPGAETTVLLVMPPGPNRVP